MKIGDPAPDIAAKDIYGRDLTLKELRGKVVVIYFWTNSCCANNLKELQGIHIRNKYRGVAIVAINEMDARKYVQSYATNNALTFTLLADDDSAIFRRYQGIGFPTIFIVDRKGVIRQKIIGNVTGSSVEKLIQRQFDIDKQAEASYEKLHRP